MEQLNSSSLIPVSAHSAVNKVKSVIATQVAEQHMFTMSPSILAFDLYLI